jgi:hypothetical protein
VQWGYIERKEHPINKRLRVYTVAYRSPAGKLSSLQNQTIVCPTSREVSQKEGTTRLEYIPLSGKEITHKRSINSVETASIEVSVVSFGDADEAILANIERAISAGHVSRTQAIESKSQIAEIQQRYDLNHSNWQRARRLYSRLEFLENDP